MSNNAINETQDSVKSVDNFERIVLDLIRGSSELQEYDYFASLAIINVIQLMLSKSDEFVKQVQKGLPFDLNAITRGNMSDQSQPVDLEIPEEIKSEVDQVIADIREKLDSEKE